MEIVTLLVAEVGDINFSVFACLNGFSSYSFFFAALGLVTLVLVLYAVAVFSLGCPLEVVYFDLDALGLKSLEFEFLLSICFAAVY